MSFDYCTYSFCHECNGTGSKFDPEDNLHSPCMQEVGKIPAPTMLDVENAAGLHAAAGLGCGIGTLHSRIKLGNTGWTLSVIQYSKDDPDYPNVVEVWLSNPERVEDCPDPKRFYEWRRSDIEDYIESEITRIFQDELG